MSDDDSDDFDMNDLLEDALAGDPEAQYRYGRELWMVAETQVEYDSAYVWMMGAARRRHGDAWWKLAVCADDGTGCERPDHELAVRLATIGWKRTRTPHCCTIAGDALSNLGRHDDSARWYRTGAEAGYDDAMTSLGVCYRYGNGVPRDFGEMVSWYVRAARAGSAAAMWNLSICRRNGEGVRSNPRSELFWERRAAAAGHEAAAVRVACASIDGRLVPAAPELGRAELERLAVEERNADAAHALGSRLIDGDGLPRDVEDAIRWLTWAQDMGSVDAATDLAVTYFNGREVDRDVEKAVALYRWAAERGDSVAIRNLGHCHLDGDGVDCDPSEGLRLFEQAAEMGDVDGACLAARHHLSDGEGASPERAVALLRSVLDNESPEALRLLADCLEAGRGCDRDADEATRLRALADARDAVLGE